MFCSITAAANKLKLLLSFAVGGLLGDVFLHLLPEAWATVDKGKFCMTLNPYSIHPTPSWNLFAFIVMKVFNCIRIKIGI